MIRENAVPQNSASETPNTEITVPPALQRRVMKQYGGAAIVAVFTIICMVMLQSWGYMIGFLFSGYLAWIGKDMVRRWYNGEIICRKVVCLKVQKVPLMKNKLIVVLRDIDAEIGDENAIRNYYVPTSSKEAAQFSERVIMNIYVEAGRHSELLAWQIVDILDRQ